ncbi:bifunctional oligoribonuclease/PAP phosphatase NrnA [Patescibacteria group bacterium]|nr:bifunctional oligoribonuclease/PAP phosphatase NrnA [Patescibacteria group bacterium]
MQKIFDQLKREIEKFNAFSIVCHKRPDGDAIGSVLAFAQYLKSAGKEVRLYCKDSVPAYLKFLEGANEIKTGPDEFWRGSDVIMLLDCGDLSMTGIDKNNFENHKLITIDHHASNSGYADINIIVSQSSATSEILYNYFVHVGFQINKAVATHLLCGIYTDTDSFTNLGTTPESLRVSSELLSLGADFRDITAYTMRNKSIASLKLWGRALERLRFDQKKGIATTVLRREDFNECNATNDDAEGVANLLNHLSGVKMAMVLRELSGGEIKGSLRTTSELIDVSQVAKLMGGGGHKKAAGFTVRGRIEETDKGWKIVE